MATDSEATPVELGLDDSELFGDALTDTPAETPAADDAPAEQPDAQARDEQGRFAAKDEKTEQPAEQPATEAAKEAPDEHGQVPSWRVREINEEKRAALARAEAAERNFSEMKARLDAMERQQKPAQPAPEQPKEQRPDPLVDPEGYERYMEQKFERRLQDDRRELSLSLAHRTYKQDFEEAFASAEEAMAKGDIALLARMQRSRDPGETLMEWHKEQKVMREVGNDPNAFFEKRLETFLSDPANLAKVMERAKGAANPVNTQTNRPNVQIPPSLASMSRADNSRGGGNDDSDLSDEGLFKYAIR